MAIGGRASHADLPYFNVEFDGGGVIIAMGWPGQWTMDFERDLDRGLRVRGGQDATHFVLRPGEEVRGPLIALLEYEGDRIDGQNIWRRWMLAHNVPRLDGRTPSFIGGTCGTEMDSETAENQIRFIDRYVEKGIPIDRWHMDAGWYPNGSGRWFDTGNWEVDRRRFPDGIREVTDRAHEHGLLCTLWFEPERVVAGTELADRHPEWLISMPPDPSMLVDLGDPDAWEWVVQRVDSLIESEGVDLYRQDFNMAPLEYWRSRDAWDRQGITEIRHIEGYLRFWDVLRERHPDILLDTCASGGRRLDLETMRRSIPLHTSDHDYHDFEARQGFAYGLSSWFPVFGTGVAKWDEVDTYAFRSGVGAMLGIHFDVRRDDLDFDLLRQLVEEWRIDSQFFVGDFYPLTAHSADRRSWLAWQFHRPET